MYSLLCYKLLLLNSYFIHICPYNTHTTTHPRKAECNRPHKHNGSSTHPPSKLSPTWKTGPTPTQVLACQADGPSTTSQRVLQICARCICCWALQHEAAETQHTSLRYDHHAPRTRSRHSRAAGTLVVIVLEAGLLYRLTAAQHRLCSSRNALSPHSTPCAPASRYSIGSGLGTRSSLQH